MRGTHVQPPDASLVLEAGDELLFVAAPEREAGCSLSATSALWAALYWSEADSLPRDAPGTPVRERGRSRRPPRTAAPHDYSSNPKDLDGRGQVQGT